jgi:PKD repeat protein
MSQRRARTTALTIVLMLAAGGADAAAHDRHSRPDLTVRALTEPPTFAAPGSTFTAEDVTVNEGRRRASRSWTGYRLAHGGRVGGRPVPALHRWERSRGSAVVTVPPAIADGAYRLVACADALHAVRERDERDNCRSSAGVVVVDTASPPAPVIVAGPAEVTSSSFASFAFSNEETGVRFECALDGGEPAPCESPHEYADLEEGDHVFVVRAVDAAGNRGAEVGHEWRVVPTEMTLGDGAWSWFADPRAVHDAARGRTYVGWVTRDGDVKVAAYDHLTFARTTANLHPALERDDHANPAIQLLPDGRLRVFYSRHTGPQMYHRTSVAPGDVSAWHEEQTVPGNTVGPRGYTYPNPIRLEAERRTYLFWRGGNYQPTFATQADGSEAWSAPSSLINVPGERPYAKYDSDGADTIHVAFTNAHPREADDVNIYYVAYRGGELRRADDTLAGTLAAPLVPGPAELVYDGPQNAWVHDVAHDAEGRPVIVFARFPEPGDHRYMYARWTGAEWAVHEIAAAGGSISDDGREEQYSAGITLDHEDPSVVYLSHPVDGAYEVETWRTLDGGASWGERRVITSGSSVKNVRPVSPRGLMPFTSDLAVVWMRGVYTSYVDYSTSITTILATGGNAPPVADAELSPRTGPAPQEIAFDGRASRDADGQIAEWRWDFGDGGQATGAQVRHVYGRPGRYFPALTVLDDGGRTDVAVEEVQIGPSEVPLVRTGPATEVGDGVATLNGSLDPRNQPAVYRFEYGLTTAYGGATPEQVLEAGLGSRAVSATVTGLVPGARYHYRLVARNATGETAGGDRAFTAATPGASAYREAILATPGLAAYWRLGDLAGTAAADQRDAHPGTYAGAFLLGEEGALPSDPDTSAGFDGVSGEMTAAGPALGDGRGTLEGWFDWRAGVTVMRDHTSTAGVGWILAFDSSGRLFYRAGGVNFNTGRTVASVLGRWHHMAVTNDGTEVAFYLDGERVHRAAATIATAPTLPWHVMRNGNHPTQFSAGRADEVAVYDRALPAETLRRHFQAGAAGP